MHFFFIYLYTQGHRKFLKQKQVINRKGCLMQGVGEQRDGLPKAMRRFGVLHVYLDCDNGFWIYIKT